MTTDKQDIATRVTNRIIASIEAGQFQEFLRWNSAGGGIRTQYRQIGKPYTGINAVLLALTAFEAGYAASTWMTFKQALDLGGNVRKGEKGSLVVYYGQIEKKDDAAEDGEFSSGDKVIRFLKGYTVFNVDQIEKLPEQYYAKAAPSTLNEEERNATAEAFLAGTGATINHGGNRAFYRPSTDEITLPEYAAFTGAEAYYATALHELVHWTGAPKRLAREKGGTFGDAAYAFEELVAELGAAFLCAQLSISAEPREDHASYLASWLKALKGDKRFIIKAAADAQKAADYLHNAQEARRIAA